MKVIKPVVIGPAQLVSSNVNDEDVPAYDGGTDYPVGAKVVFDDAIYESVQSPNKGNQPGLAPLYWAVSGPTNRWAMFDGEVSTQTVGVDEIRVVVKPGYVNSLALLELDARTVEVVGTNGEGGEEIYRASRVLEGSVVTNWYEYFFEPFSQLSELVLVDLPPYGSLHLDVRIRAAFGNPACGEMVCGSAYDLGDSEHGGSVGIIDYSRKETSESGRTTFRKRRYSRRMSQRLWVETARFDAVYRLLSGLRATPCVWIGSDRPEYGPLTIYGFYKDFSIDVAYPLMNFCNLEIEGLT